MSEYYMGLLVDQVPLHLYSGHVGPCFDCGRPGPDAIHERRRGRPRGATEVRVASRNTFLRERWEQIKAEKGGPSYANWKGFVDWAEAELGVSIWNLRRIVGQTRTGVPAKPKEKKVPGGNPRDEAIVSFFFSKEPRYTLEQLGFMFGMTRERVRQIVQRAGYTSKDRLIGPAKKWCQICGESYEYYLSHCRIAHHKPYRRHDGLTERNRLFVEQVLARPDERIRDIAAQFGINPNLGHSIAGRAGIRRRGVNGNKIERNRRFLERWHAGASRPELAMEFAISEHHVGFLIKQAYLGALG